MARLLASGDLSPVELTRSVLERIDRINPRLETYVSVFHEEVLAAAQLATDEIVVRGSRGPLHGIPIAIKDLYDVLGKPTCRLARSRGLNYYETCCRCSFSWRSVSACGTGIAVYGFSSTPPR